MKQFFVEVFVPRSKANLLAAAEQRARKTARHLTETSGAIRYLQASYIPADETCFYVFEARSDALVAEASRLAGLGEGRVIEATTSTKGEAG